MSIVTLTLNQSHDTSLGLGQQSCEILFKFIKRVRSYGPDKLFAYVLTIMCIMTLTSDLGSRSWHFLGSSVTILWNIPIHAFSEKLWPRQCLNHMSIVTLTFDQWPWISSWHFVRSRAIIVWNIVQIYNEDQELWLGRTTDGQRHNIIRPVLRRAYKKRTTNGNAM
jgi:hypothetical protein